MTIEGNKAVKMNMSSPEARAVEQAAAYLVGERLTPKRRAVLAGRLRRLAARYILKAEVGP